MQSRTGKRRQVVTLPVSKRGKSVLSVEAIPQGSAVRLAGKARAKVAEIVGSLEEAFHHVADVVNAASRERNSFVQPPDELTMEFGINLSTKGNVIVASASIDSSFKIIVKWSA